ncbi:MAG TPA: response regulator [Terriglobia bacterium]|nr:response regulator [Terriglobia bacterium]
MTKKIVAVVDDLIFVSKIQQTATLVGVRVEMVALGKLELPENAVAAIILDLNHRSGRAIEILRALKEDSSTQGIPVIGFLSHVQADLAAAAREAGCDVLMARSAFTAQLPQLLRKYGGQEIGAAEKRASL